MFVDGSLLQRFFDGSLKVFKCFVMGFGLLWFSYMVL